MTLSVIVATYHRPETLARCLASLARQDRAPDAVIVVVRDEDAQSASVAASAALAVKLVTVDKPGVAAAYNAGLEAARHEIVAFTDDDAEPRRDWTRRIIDGYAAKPGAAGIGGRDILHRDGVPVVLPQTQRVGRVQWIGRVIGNHHRGRGPARSVDVLKGVNMSFRRDAIGPVRFDETLRGSGAQVGVELGFCLALRRLGKTLIYDPAIIVNHHSFRDEHFDPAGFSDAAFNNIVLVLRHLPAHRRVAFILYGLAIGGTGEPGFAQFVRLVVRGDRHAWPKFACGFRARLAAIRAIRHP